MTLTSRQDIAQALERQPLISIVTPSYNQGSYIRATIESVLGQDYPNIEYWVIDGGSTDETLSILREYEGDPRFHWMSEPDRGQSDALNKGIARSHGAIFGWLNSDDTLIPGALRRVAEVWCDAPGPALLYGRARYIDQDGRDLGGCPGFTPQMTIQRLACVGKYFLAQPAVFMPTDLLRALGGINADLHYMMDYHLWFRLATRLPMISVDQDLALYRLHDSSKTVAQAVHFIGEARQLLNQVAEQGLIDPRMARVRAELFAARTYFVARQWAQGLQSIGLAIRYDLGALPETLTIMVLALIRATVGDRTWALLRRLRRRQGARNAGRSQAPSGAS